MIEACIKMMLKASKDEIDIKHRIGRYEIVRTIGQGTFAKVKLGRHVETGEHVAIKIIKKDKVLKGEKMNQIKREISIMKLMKHPHVVQLYEVMASKSKIYLVMEYLPGGELSDIITYQTRLEEQEARAYFQQLIFGLEYCHSRGVCHRDLKPQNLLLDSHGNLKVADFGLSALPDQARQDGLLHTSCGTTTYAAPELLLNRGYDGAKADLWSCGVILFVLLAGYVPFNVQNISNLQRIISGKFKCPSWFSPIVKHILHRLLEPDPNKRITIHELKESDWFKNGISKKPHIGVEKNRMDMLDVLEFKEREPKPAFLNAFELITMCPGLNLSGLFEQGKELKHHCSRFTSKLSAAEVITKLEEVARVWGLKMKRREGEIQMQGTQLAVLAQVFQVAPCLLLVELRKAEGDELEYEKFYHQKLRPILNDMVWAWTNF